jgi:hypothetical protein
LHIPHSTESRLKCERDRSAACEKSGAALALPHRIVIVHTALAVLSCIVITLVTSAPIRADPAPQTRLRLTDPRLRTVVDAGRQSRLFRALTRQLEATDVVVYVQCARLPRHLAGDLTFLTAAAGVRYVLVRIGWDLPLSWKVAILGHELQHALEVARSPEIVSARTMAEAYERFGFVKSRGPVRTEFDTLAAIDAGTTIWRELAERDNGE